MFTLNIRHVNELTARNYCIVTIRNNHVTTINKFQVCVGQPKSYLRLIIRKNRDSNELIPRIHVPSTAPTIGSKKFVQQERRTETGVLRVANVDPLQPVYDVTVHSGKWYRNSCVEEARPKPIAFAAPRW